MLGEKSAELYVPSIKRDIRQANNQEVEITVPLRTADLNALLDNTIAGLKGRDQLDWENTPDVRRQVFIEAWSKVMQKHGLM